MKNKVNSIQNKLHPCVSVSLRVTTDEVVITVGSDEICVFGRGKSFEEAVARLKEEANTERLESLTEEATCNLYEERIAELDEARHMLRHIPNAVRAAVALL